MHRHAKTLSAIVYLGVGLGISSAAHASGERMIRKETVVKGSPEQVFKLWTTSDGIAKFFSPDSGDSGQSQQNRAVDSRPSS